MNNIEELKRFIYSATVTRGSGSQSFYIDAKSREEADARAANNESDGMYADDSEVTDLDALEYEDETTVDDFGDFPLISREQALIAQLEAAQKEIHGLKMKLSDAACLLVEWKKRVEKAEAALSAANERLSKPVVLPDDGLEDCINMWPDNWRNDFDTGYNFGIWRCEQNIKAAGFTVEGE
ncbi:TPA: hypothetical protein U5E31_002060 [Yersinia enterocolitica]|nr:hypothetical protein [Yersinia enterocolitica]